MKIMPWKISLLLGTCLLGIGELPSIGETGPYVQWTALSILAFAVVGLFKQLSEERRSSQKDREASRKDRELHAEIVTNLCDRWDGWEKTRHTDSMTLNETLTQVRENCAAVKGHYPKG
jgi:membrane protein implicated in regulation of membrane protease activity